MIMKPLFGTIFAAQGELAILGRVASRAIIHDLAVPAVYNQ
nr:hypothetical protein [Parabacteroides distasonis]